MPPGIYPRTPEIRAKASAGMMGNRNAAGYVHTPEECAKIRAARKRQRNPRLGTGCPIGTLSTKSHYPIRKTEDGWKREHRLIYEGMHGPIPPKHDVHHIDGNRQNNTIQNLVVMTRSEHTKFHRRWDCALPK